MKTATVVLSNPKSGSGESLGRPFNAPAATYDFKQRGDEVRGRVVGLDHLAHDKREVAQTPDASTKAELAEKADRTLHAEHFLPLFRQVFQERAGELEEGWRNGRVLADSIRKGARGR